MNEVHDSKVVYLRLDDIIPNRFQPREIFDETGLQELSESIKEHGILQPIIVRELGDKYELIAGERRIKASAIAGNTTIPAIIRNMDDKESAKVSLLENLQRKNLSPIEEARTYKRILELDSMTQEDLARSMGRSQPMVANKLRLLSLPEEIQEALMKNQISERHARSLLTIKDKKNQLKFLDRIRNERLTVRELDSEIKKFKDKMEVNNIEDKEEKENNERSFMNNNRGNFGGMGLNDYHTGVNNNMFNNIPNNFNNMQTVNNTNQINYNNFDETDNQQDNNNQPNDYLESMNQNNNELNGSSNNSLGSMFDGYNNEPENYQSTNEDNSNLFVSHIREDNLPKTENQFLPNFDNFNVENDNKIDNDIETEAMNNFNQNNSFNDNNYNPSFDMNNNYNLVNDQPNMNPGFNDYNSNINNNYQNDINQNNMINQGFNYNNNFDMNSNMNPGFNNSFVPNNNYNPNMSQMNNSYNMNNNYNPNLMNNNMYNNSNYYMNNPNMMNNNPMNNNMYGMNSYNNQMPYFNNNYNMNPNMYGPNQGGMFSEPLNIVDVPNNINSEMPNIEENNPPVEEPKNLNINETDENNDNYENILFSKPTTIEEESDESGEAKELESSVSDIEVIGENENNEETIDNKPELNEETKDDYINIDPVYTINSTMDAVLEIKKTTDRIKQNHIDIETEEIDFDDVYQITIKIKKTDTL